jgi:glycosyltransferase involved in cell wall biosynthesis
MHYVLVDDSVPFDGYTSARRPLGGAEKAFASLAAALASRGHDVTVINRTPYPVTAEGVRYKPIEEIQQRPLEADVVLAFRQPSLLGAVRKAKHRLLWVVAAPDYLTASANKSYWESFKPTLLFVSAAQQQAYRGALPHRLLAPAVRATFYEPITAPELDPYPDVMGDPMGGTTAPAEPARVPPHAVVTTHPLHGLYWITEIWRRLIHPQLPEARLAVYSTVLAKGMRDEPVPENIQPILARVKQASDANVVVIDPRSDRGMAEVYRASRIHFYPGHEHDYACWTLMESQAAGTPAIARNLGGVDERIVNGQTGFVVPDAAAVANVALELLRNDAVHQSFSAAATDISRRRTWDMAAAELDDMIAGLVKA